MVNNLMFLGLYYLKFGDIRARSMNGFEVYTNQQMFDFEVRI